MSGFTPGNRTSEGSRRIPGWVAAIAILGASGCQQRAFTELYVETLARDFRRAEDLINEFEAENLAMEYEIEDLRRVNQQLQSRLQEAQSAKNTLGSAGQNIERKPLIEGLSPSDGRRNGSGSGTPNPSSLLKSPPPLKLQPPKDVIDTDIPDVVVPKKGQGLQLSTPAKESAPPLSNPTSGLEKFVPENPTDLLPPDASAAPKLEIPNREIPGSSPAEVIPSAPKPVDAKIPNSGNLPRGEALPAGERKTIPTKEPLLKPAPNGLPDEVSAAVLQQRKIYTPPMSGVVPASAISSAESSAESNAIQSKPIDTKIRGIDFHPTLCRGHNFDGKPGDDGLSVVLVTCNDQHQFVPGEGTMTIVAEETLPDGQSARLGRWEIPSAQLQDCMEPIGAGQGYHLRLPWENAFPETTEIDVWVRFAMTDGTKVVNRKQIHLRKPNHASSTWTPR
ncbi:MAG: hypothetical protein WCI02_00960 [Planctomycetota bacterium]